MVIYLRVIQQKKITMRIYTQLFLVFLFTFKAASQHTEFGISLNSGLFSFRGPSAEKVTSLNLSDINDDSYTNNPYGSKNGLVYGLSLRLQQITKGKLIYNIELGYENLRSKILINQIFPYQDFGTIRSYKATGKTILSHHFINAYPSIGFRIKLKKYSMDLIAGTELAYCLFAYEKGSAKNELGVRYTSSKNRSTIRFDFRPRIQATFNYKEYGIYTAYSNGLMNYKSGYVGGINECYSRIIRFGLNYKF